MHTTLHQFYREYSGRPAVYVKKLSPKFHEVRLNVDLRGYEVKFLVIVVSDILEIS